MVHPLHPHSVNVMTGPREDRQLITGLHTVCDIQCTNCGAVLGWKYVRGWGGCILGCGVVTRGNQYLTRTYPTGICI